MTCKYNLRLFAFSISLVACSSLSRSQQPELPQITAVEPKAGITSLGSKVTVYGRGFSPQTVLYFDGLEVRETKFIGPSALEVVPPYLRPGVYMLQLKSGDITVRSEISFTASPSPIDSEIDRAVALAEKGQTDMAIAALTNIAKTCKDYQVRSFAHYQMAQIYFSIGDWWRWGGEAAGPFEREAGRAVQTSWRYRLQYAESVYLLPIDSDADTPLVLADGMIKYDVTENPEPRFFRGLINARYDNLEKAKVDSDLILRAQPENMSYRALAAYIAVLAGDRTHLQSFSSEPINDPSALALLGEAAYLSGHVRDAELWWSQEAKVYPLGASLAYWAGKKHLARGHQRIAVALLTESATMAPSSKEGKEAKDLLSGLHSPGT